MSKRLSLADRVRLERITANTDNIIAITRRSARMIDIVSILPSRLRDIYELARTIAATVDDIPHRVAVIEETVQRLDDAVGGMIHGDGFAHQRLGDIQNRIEDVARLVVESGQLVRDVNARQNQFQDFTVDMLGKLADRTAVPEGYVLNGPDGRVEGRGPIVGGRVIGVPGRRATPPVDDDMAMASADPDPVGPWETNRIRSTIQIHHAEVMGAVERVAKRLAEHLITDHERPMTVNALDPAIRAADRDRVIRDVEERFGIRLVVDDSLPPGKYRIVSRYPDGRPSTVVAESAEHVRDSVERHNDWLNRKGLSDLAIGPRRPSDVLADMADMAVESVDVVADDDDGAGNVMWTGDDGVTMTTVDVPDDVEADGLGDAVAAAIGDDARSAHQRSFGITAVTALADGSALAVASSFVRDMAIRDDPRTGTGYTAAVVNVYGNYAAGEPPRFAPAFDGETPSGYIEQTVVVFDAAVVNDGGTTE